MGSIKIVEGFAMLSPLILKHLRSRGIEATNVPDGIHINGVICPFVNHPPLNHPFFHIAMDQYWPIPSSMEAVFPMDHWVLASSNAGKINEYRSFLEGVSFNHVSQSKSLDVQEYKHTFYENALIKSAHAAHIEPEGTVVLSDDSGFCLSSIFWDQLDLQVKGAKGIFPGVYTKRFAQSLSPEINYSLAAKWISSQFELPMPAYFECAIALTKNEGGLLTSQLFQGVVHGQCVDYQEGEGLFGFDPLFIPSGHEVRFSQMSGEEKGAISHRGQAIKALQSQLKI